MQEGSGLLLRPILGLYARLYALAAAPAAREAETAADGLSLQVAGPQVAAEALRAVVRAELVSGLLHDQYLPLFEDADARAPMGEGMRRLAEANRDDLQGLITQVIAAESTSLTDTHPPMRKRIAAFEAARDDGQARPSSGDQPASTLLTGGEATLATLEADLLLRDRELISWDDLVARAGARQVAENAREITRFLRARGHGHGRLAAALALADVRTPEGSAYLELVASADDVTADTAFDNAVDSLTSLVLATMISADAARFAARWDGPMRPVDPQGREVPVGALVAAALTTADTHELRDWLADQGVDVESAEPARPDDIATWLAALTHVKLGEQRYDVHLWSHGICCVPLTPGEVKRDKDSATHGVQRPRVEHQAALGLQAGRDTAGARWHALHTLGGVSVSGRMRITLTVTMLDGTTLKLQSSGVDGAPFPGPDEFGYAVGELQQRLAEQQPQPAG